jgi:citrate lyase subunit gamma (acyl carrier protein)
MRIARTGTAGSLESSDVLITVEPNPREGLEVDLQSNTESRFGRQIRQVIEDTLRNLKVTDARVRVQDRSALDSTIRARLTAAVYRAAGISTFKWEEL